MKGDTRCEDGRLLRHDPQPDDPGLETDMGKCPECEGKGCSSAGHVGQCDCCGKHGELAFSIAYGIETWSCAEGCEEDKTD